MSGNVQISPDTATSQQQQKTSDSQSPKSNGNAKDSTQVKCEQDEIPALLKVEKAFTKDSKIIQYGGEDSFGRASVINYNLPSATRYSGRTITNLGIPFSYFHPQNALHQLTAEEKLTAAAEEETYRKQQEELKRKAAEEIQARQDEANRIVREREAAVRARQDQYQAYVQRIRTQNESALNNYNYQKNNGIPDSLNSAIAGIRGAIQNFDTLVRNQSNFEKYKACTLWGAICWNGIWDAVRDKIATKVVDLRSPINQVPARLTENNTFDFEGKFTSVESACTSIETEAKNLKHDDVNLTRDLQDRLTNPMTDIRNRIGNAKGIISSLTNIGQPPTAQETLDFATWDQQNRAGQIAANRLSALPVNDADLMALPRYMRRIAVNKILPGVHSVRDLERLQAEMRKPDTANRIFLTTSYPDGTRQEGRPETEKLEFWRNRGYIPRLIQSLSGEYFFEFVKSEQAEVNPRIVLIESYAISIFLGDYGAGKTLQTFTLLPGERTKITIKTYTRSQDTMEEASTIFDSSSQSAMDNFESNLERTNESTAELKDEFKVGLKGSYESNLATISKTTFNGDMSNDLTVSRKDFAKALSKAAQTHTSTRALKRETNITKSRETTTEMGKEEGLEREINNVNLSRVLNFVFRQLNQQYIMISHLTDVKVAFANGFEEDYKEVPLHEVDSLLRLMLKDEKVPENDPSYAQYPEATYAEMVKRVILKTLRSVSDYTNHLFDVTEEVPDLSDPSIHTGKYRFKKIKYSDFCRKLVNNDEERLHKEFPDLATDSDHGVEGIIISLDSIVLPTDAVIIEALLGQGVALDGFALGSQDQALREKILENDRLQLALDIVRLKNMTPEQAKLAADLYYKIFGLTPMKMFAERTYPVIFPELKKTVQNLSVE